MTVEVLSDGDKLFSTDIAQYIRLRLESQDVLTVTSISGIPDPQE